MLVIFDWDGTLCDSTAKIVRCMQGAAHAVGMPVLDSEAICNIIGLGLPEALLQLYPDITPVQTAALREAYSRIFMHTDQTPSPFFPQVEEVMHELRDAGYTLALATGKSRRGLDRVLSALGMQAFFHATRCADETASKPHPQMLQELLTQFRRSSHEAVMVGDTEYDMAMARSVHMPRIAVSYGAHHVDRLRPYLPVLCADQFAEVGKYLATPNLPEEA